MQNPKHLNLLINLGGALVGLIVVGYVVYAAFHTEVEQPCSTRFPAATRFSLQTGAGKPLTAVELQARAGLRDLGVIDNARVVPVEGGPSPEALEVKLRDLPPGDDPDAKLRNGIEFRWSPPGIAGANSACLSYSVWLPDKFDFGGGGVLPGVFGGEPAAPRQRALNDRLAVTFEWSAEGQPSLVAALDGGEHLRMSGAGPSLPTNRWVKIEQEIVLNDPGQPNGLVRLWVDDELIGTSDRVPLRLDDKALLTGVLVAIGYEREPASTGMLRLSPIEIGWR
jgi:hypothetical protein